MKIGTQTKLCFVPIGATVEIAGVDWILMSKSDDFEIGLIPTSSAGWYGHTNVLEKLFLRSILTSNDKGVSKIMSWKVTIVKLPTKTEPEQPKRSSNVERNIAALMREDAKTVEVAFNGGSKSYTYITSLDIKVGDHAVVDCGGDGFKVVQVLEVHDDVEVEPNSDTKFKWVVAKFDLEHHKSNEAKNEQIEKLMATGYRANIRRHFAANMMACLSDEKKAELTAIVSGEQVIDVQPERRTHKKS